MTCFTFRTSCSAFLLACGALAQSGITPRYTITDLGVVQSGDSFSQGFGISDNGLATGRSFRTGATQAFSWSSGGGMVGLQNLTSPARNFGVGNGVNNAGIVVGTAATTSFGSSPLPVMWQNGIISQLALPSGQTLGRATDVNNTGIAVGSVNGGSLERAAIYSSGSGSVITQTTSNGSYMTSATGVNDSGWVVGNGIDPNNAALNVGMVYDMISGVSFAVGALPGLNGALAFDVSNGGHVVGSSMQFQGSGTPYIWTLAGGMAAIPLPVGTSQGSARGVNASGWAVGTASSAFAIPFVFDGFNTYRIADVVDNIAGWDLATNTSSSAESIGDNGMIVGTGVYNGVVHAYVLTPVPEPATLIALGLGATAVLRRKNR